MKQENRGGKRINAGYKGKYIESTVLVSLRVPISKESQVRQSIKDICEPLIKVKESKPLLPAVFSFSGWSDENCKNPKKDGIYLCLCKWMNLEEYQYHILEFSKKDKWEVTDSCEHIIWTILPLNPFLKNSM